MKVFNLNGMNTEEKDSFIHYIEEMLMKQALSQHIELIGKDNWTYGKVTEWRIIREEDYCGVEITYEKGKFLYDCIDCGAEGMTITEVSEN